MKRFLVFLLVFSSLGQAATIIQVGPIVSNVVSPLTDAANISMDASVAYTFSLALGGNRTLDNPSNQVAGGLYVLLITQDGTGGRVLTYGTAWRFPAAVPPVLSTDGGTLDALLFVSDGTYMNYLSIQKNDSSPLATPTSVAVVPAVEKCTLSWVNNAGDQTAVNVYAAQDPGDVLGSGSPLATLGPTETSYEDLLPGLTGQTYHYAVRAKKGATLSAFSSVADCLVQ